MVKNRLVALSLLMLLLAGASDGFSFSFASRRVLAAEDGKQKPQQKVSPSPTPVPLPKSDPVPLPSPPPPPPPPPNAEQSPKDADNSNGKDSQKGPSGSDNSVLVPPPTLASEPPPAQASVPPPPQGSKTPPPPPQASEPPPSQALPPPPPAVAPPPPVLVRPPPASVPPPLPGGVEGKSPQNPSTEDDAKKSNADSSGTGSGTETKLDAGCAGKLDKCRAPDFVACLQRSDDSKELFLVVQNGGDDALKVNIRTSIPIDLTSLQVAKRSTEKVSVSSNATEVIQLVLNNGKGDCILQIRPSVPDWNPFQQFPAYATQLTPIHGAYFLFVTVVIAGGTWACCKFGRKARRGGDGIPYQQLEMGAVPQSSSAIAHANTTDGWDQNWDNNWDEEDAIGRTSEIQPAGDTINGHTSKHSNKGGWDDDWDD